MTQTPLQTLLQLRGGCNALSPTSGPEPEWKTQLQSQYQHLLLFQLTCESLPFFIFRTALFCIRGAGEGRPSSCKKKKAFFKQSKNFKRNSGRLNSHQEGREEREANKWHAPQVYEYLNYISLKKIVHYCKLFKMSNSF